MSYSPTLGRWMEQDPAGYVDAANLYDYVGSNPVDGLDPLGLYTLDWGTGFTAAEQQRIKDSLTRVQTRVNSLLTEIDGQLKNEKCKPITDALNKLRGIISAMQTDLDPNKGDTLHLTTNGFNPDAPLRWTKGRGTDMLCLNPPEVRRSFGSAIALVRLHDEA